MKLVSAIKPSTRGLALVAPKRLHEGLAVLLRSSPKLSLLAASSSVGGLAATIGVREPELVLLYAIDSANDKHRLSHTGTDIAEIRSTWPAVTCVAIISYPASQAEQRNLGADAILFEGVTPDRLLATLNELAQAKPGKDYCCSRPQLSAQHSFHSTADQGGQTDET